MKEIFTRISVRKFEDRPVEEEKITQILKAAMAAPSAGNQRPWEYYVVRDKAVIEALSKSSPYAGCVANAPVVIVPCVKKEGLHFPELAEIDLAATTENILLEVVSQGLGAVWIGIAPFADRIAAAGAALNIEDNLYTYALIPVGYPGESRPQQDRFEESRIHYIV